MPVSTRRNPLDPEDRAREDDLSTVDHRDEIPQEQPQLDTSSGAPRAGAGRSASLFDRMRASLGGVDAPEVSDDQGDQAAVGPPVFSESQQNELKNLFDANSDKLLEAMRAMLESTKPPDRTGGSTLAGGRPAGDERVPLGADKIKVGMPDCPGSALEQDDFVPDLGHESVHARAQYEGGDTYTRPQRYVMCNDPTYDA